MPRKLTQQEFLERLYQRNNKNPEYPIFLDPENQQYQGQKSKLQFKCINNHSWIGTFDGSISSGQGCLKCKIQTDAKNKSTPFDELKQQFDQIHESKYEYIKESYISKMKHMTMICNLHGSFQCIPFEHIEFKRGCIQCKQQEISHQNKQNFIERSRQIHNDLYSYENVEYINAYTPIKITCKIHGIFDQRPGDHLNKHGCSSCTNTSISIKQITWLEKIAKNTGIMIQHACNIGEYRIPETKYSADGFCKQTKTIYEFHGDAFHGNLQIYHPTDCCHPFDKTITAQQLFDNTKFKEQTIINLGYNLVSIWENDFNKLNIPLITIDYSKVVHRKHEIPAALLKTLHLELVDSEFKGFVFKHNFKCLVCDNVFKTTLTQRKQSHTKYKTIGCPACNARDIKFINLVSKKLLGLTNNSFFIVNDDIIDQINKFVIIPIDQNKPLSRKFVLCKKLQYESQEYKVFVIFEDEWINNHDLVLSKIKHYMGQNTTTLIHARKCIIQQVTNSKIKSEFLNKNHIQGNDNAQISYGAYYNDQLVAIMTFTTPRVAVGYKNKDRTQYQGKFELSRFTTDINYRIPGIASKLLKHFQKNHQWSEIYSYADRRWSVGNVYEKLGFTLTATNPPSYWYVIDGQRKHRWNYRKDVIKNTLPNYDAKLTEYQNMQNHGYHRVWDCGTLKYVILNV